MRAEKVNMPNGAVRYRPIFHSAELEDLVGFCLGCGAEALGVDPDARRCRCESCFKPFVYGLEELVIMGIAKLSNDHEEVD